MTGQQFQLTMDAANPQALGAFWAYALGYIEEPAPEGFDSWEAALTAWGVPEEKWNDGYAIVPRFGEQAIGERAIGERAEQQKGLENSAFHSGQPCLVGRIGATRVQRPGRR
jgi:hypothetical protein